MAPMFLSDIHLLKKGHFFLNTGTRFKVVRLHRGCLDVFVWLFFPQADGEEIPKSSGDESEPSKIDPSRLGSELVKRMVEFQTEIFAKHPEQKPKDILIKNNRI